MGVIKFNDESFGGGASNLSGLSDVSISSATNGQVLKYDSANSVWKNANESGGGGGGGIDYSTIEQDTGLKWIDGRPIYQKTYYLSTFNSTIDSSFTPDVYDNYWQTFVYWKYVTDGNHYVGSMFGGTGGCIYTECDSRGLLSANFTGLTPEDIYITIQYTKTADL